MGIAPSEVRQMTLGEIGSVIWAKHRDSEQAQQAEQMDSMYRKLKRIKGRTP